MMFSIQPASPFDPPSLIAIILSSPIRFLLRTTYIVCNYLRISPAPSSPAIRIVCISDTHSNVKSIPDGDVLIHAGDLTKTGTPSELQAQLDWLSSLPHAHKVAIAGNHDTYLDPRSRTTLPPSDLDKGPPDWRKIHYLQHSSITLSFPDHTNRQLRIFGAPQIPACGGDDFAFQYKRGQDAWTDTIPSDTDILITHTPPKYHLDLPVSELGCEFLLREIWRVKPRLHVCGHVHAGRGTEILYWDEAQRSLEHGLSRWGGLVLSSVDPFLWIDLVKVAGYGVAGLLWERLWVGRKRATWLVNASLMFENSGRLGNEAHVVYI